MLANSVGSQDQDVLDNQDQMWLVTQFSWYLIMSRAFIWNLNGGSMNTTALCAIISIKVILSELLASRIL